MPLAFSNRADFSGISKDTPLKISKIKHKTYVDVTEKGTEAAAVTSFGVDAITAMGSPVDRFNVKVDRPFFFTIRDNDTGLILFMGYIQDPRN